MKTKTQKKRKRRAGRGSLMMIAALLFGSAVVRLGNDAGQVYARESAPSALAPPVTTQSCETPEDMRRVLAELQNRDAQLARQETALQSRAKALDITGAEIEKKLTALIAAEEKLRATIALADTAAEDDIGRLISVYENMKPKDAAALFEQMDPQFSAGFLGRMRPDAAAGIMAGLQPQTAYTISVVLAGRNAKVPTE